MKAIDEIDRVRREGRLTFSRHAPPAYDLDQEVVEEVVISLSTPRDPPGRCVEKVAVQWTSIRTMGSLIPSIYLDGGEAKLLALFPQILAPFVQMNGGHLTPDALIEGLKKVGVVAGHPDKPYVSPTITCARCGDLYRKTDCMTVDTLSSSGVICKWCVWREEHGATVPGSAEHAATDCHG